MDHDEIFSTFIHKLIHFAMKRVFQFLAVCQFSSVSLAAYCQDPSTSPPAPTPVVIYNPSGGGSTSGATPSAVSQEQGQLKSARNTKNAKYAAEKQAREQQAARDEQRSVIHYKENGNQQIIDARTFIEVKKAKGLEAKLANYPRGKEFYNKAQEHAERLAAFKDSINIIQNSGAGRRISTKMNIEAWALSRNISMAEHLLYVANNKNQIVENCYLSANKKLLFAQESKIKLENLKNELIKKTSNTTSDWMEVKGIVGLSMQETANLIKLYLMAFASAETPWGEQSVIFIDVTDTYIQTIIEHAVANDGNDWGKYFSSAYTAAAFQALIDESERRIKNKSGQGNFFFIPQKINMIYHNIKDWQKFVDNHNSLKGYVSDEFLQINDSIDRMNKIIAESNRIEKSKIDHAIDVYLIGK